MLSCASENISSFEILQLPHPSPTLKGEVALSSLDSDQTPVIELDKVLDLNST